MSLPKIIVDVTGRAWSQCENLSCPALEHPEDLHSHEVQIVMSGRVDRYLKEDPERAEAVLQTLYRDIDALVSAWNDNPLLFDRAALLARFYGHKQFLMDVFRAVRGERD